MSTALKKYQRLEATGLWRAGPEAQRREVIVSIGNATLVITDLQDRPLTHWSLPALVRANPGAWPALYHPDGDEAETLEFSEDEAEMITAIEKLRAAINKQRPHPGRLRWLMMGASLASVVAVGVFWLPGALVDHAVSVVPPAKRAAIGQALLEQVEYIGGTRCSGAAAQPALDQLAQRLNAIAPEDLKIAVIPGGQPETVMLPGQTLLLNSRLLEDYEEPDVAAGFILAEVLRAETSDPLRLLLNDTGLFASLTLMATGDLDTATLRSHAETLLTRHPDPVPNEALLQAFRISEVKSSPYGYALDVSGETSLPLIEADPFPAQAPRAVLSDSDWLRLQSICEG